ncbi:MAG: hypothetical protein VX438_17280 [Planctomycetota bacterium]|nr:hypothetical protein [Planctomycetota bacterium]
MTGNLEELGLPVKDRLLLEFVELITRRPFDNSPQQIDILRNAGWSDGQISETVLVVGLFSMFNRIADAFGLEDPDYFTQEKNGQPILPATRSGVDD